jgi:acyl-[acyl-carrier-protein]-phospholipid O-acyltransferase/long-chain-fatty-acid--[acyl-carrier-protein] ligase
VAASVWPQQQHAVVTRPDARKGEQLILLTTRIGAERSELSTWIRQEGLGELHLPKRIIEVKAIPVLGTGKIDYRAVQERANAEVAL